MFTGIVEGTGRVVDLQAIEGGTRIRVDAGTLSDEVQLGDSIAHNGCCLTVSGIENTVLSYDLLEETLRATNLGNLKEGSIVNLERSLAMGDRIGGHFVTGHIDGKASITLWEQEESGDYTLEIEVPLGGERYIVPKGCIAIDGISLTVGKVEGNRFNVWIIPHTREVTALSERQAGDAVNIEFDMLAKYTEKLLSSSK
ncbi:MAG: riboflavin synthase [Verrucomicrobiota bacterium]